MNENYQSPAQRIMATGFHASILIVLAYLFMDLPSLRAEPQSPFLPSPSKIREILLHGGQVEKKRMVESLKLFLPRGARWGNEQLPCLEYQTITGQASTIELSQVVLKAPKPYTVIVAKPQDCEYQFLVVMDQIAPGRWAHLATVPILAKNWEPEISFARLIDPDESEIIVRNRTTDTGLGMHQRNITILKLFEGGLSVIFNEVEKQTFFIPITRNGEPADTEQSQESEFWLIDAEAGTQSIKNILERQVIGKGGKQIIRWRIFVWSPELKVFEGVPTEGNLGEGKEGTMKLGLSNLDK